MPIKLFPNLYKYPKNKIMSTPKESIQSILKQLPDNCSVEDIQYHLYVSEKVRRSIEVADTRGTRTHNEAKERLSKWLIK